MRYTDEAMQRAEKIDALRSALTLTQLRDAARARDVGVSGTKTEVATRLYDAGYDLTAIFDGAMTPEAR